MPYDPTNRRRPPLRLASYDYRTSGIYFVTICTHGRRRLFDDATLRLVAERQWLGLPARYPRARLDAWVVMADHLHGLPVLEDVSPRPNEEVSQDETRVHADSGSAGLGIGAQPGSVGAIVRAYKGAVTRRIRNRDDGIDGAVWQHGYYDRIICNQAELDATRQYIVNNPVREAEGRDNLGELIKRMHYLD
jgi:putative transposase